MQILTAEEIIAATNGNLISGDIKTIISGITIDSRNAGDGMLFVPLKGENSDGHDYIEGAIKNGAAAVITHRDLNLSTDKCIIRVPDTRRALGDIARLYKSKYNLPTAAVTGSVGKTTTKDMIHSALSSKKRTLKTQKNFNNDIGVPLTVFGIEKEHELAVIEMGMNHFGEIEYLSSIVKPDVAVITNIGMSHIENLGDRNGILKAKMEITADFTDKNTLIINGDDEYLKTVRNNKPYRVVTYGMSSKNDVYAKDIKSRGIYGVDFTAVADGREYEVKVNIPGTHNVYNALAAICVCREFGIDITSAISGIENTSLTENRLEIEDIGEITVIKDYYNASFDSIKSALEILSTETERRKAAILGDIFELGDYAENTHRKLGKNAAESGAELLITAGKNAAYIAEEAEKLGIKDVLSFETTEEAAEAARKNIKAGDVVLIKASHGMHFEKIYEALKN